MDVWKQIKQLGDMDPRRLDNDNNQLSAHYCEHYGHLFSFPVNTSIKEGGDLIHEYKVLKSFA